MTPHIAVITGFLSLMWGIYLFSSINDYRQIRRYPERRKGEVLMLFRRVVVGLCIFSISFSYLFRTSMVLLGFGEEVAGQITFYALLGTNIPGAIFSVISLRYD